MAENKKLLMVDENFKSHENIFSKFLKTKGVDCMVVNNGFEATEAIAVNKFDLVLVNIGTNRCKDTDPYDERALNWVRDIRQCDKTVKIVVLNACLDDAKRVKDFGADFYFEKLFNVKEHVLKPLGLLK